MTKLSYEKPRVVMEQCEFEIEDDKNVFLEGYCEDGQPCYFGVWQSNKGLRIVTITNHNDIKVQYSLYKSGYVNVDIKKFLSSHNNVNYISKEILFKEINDIKSLLIE